MESSSDARRLSKTVCLLCRQRKIRCNRKLPKCESCTRAAVECQYIAVRNRPGLRAGYVSELEERLAKLEREVQLLKADRPVGPASMVDVNSVATSSSSDHSIQDAPASIAHISPRSARCSPSDFDPLSSGILDELCRAWFEKYHPWFPILHQPSLLEVLQTSPILASTVHYIVFKAVAAVTIPHSYHSDSLTNDQRRTLSDDLRSQVVMEAISQLSLQSLQAVLILTIRDYGAGRLSEFWNLIALAKRMGTQLGLRDLVANQCDNFHQISTIPPRMLPLPNSLVNREEKIRAYWMTEVLDGSSTVGAAWNLNISRPESTGLLPCSDTIWSFPEAVISAWSFGDFEMSSAYSLYVMLVTNELYHVHRFLQQSFDTQSATERVQWQNECRAVDEGLIAWRVKFAAAQVRMNAEHGGSYDPNIILTHCALDLATISLYQRLALPPSGLEEAQGPWYHAIQRCLDACDSITNVLRAMHDMNLENISPLIISCIFVAARFFLVHAKLLNVEIPRNLDLLVYSLKTCGLRWSYARRLEKVIRTATADHKLPSSMSSLPVQFYDLQYSYLDIDEALRVWAEGLEPWMHLAGLEHPALDQNAILMPNVNLATGMASADDATFLPDTAQLAQA
ncbi:hypothetical protein BU26DRAFT_524829 [Trematosphaeria pertusa]|uniref:Zn(2)-C6 fungal-type domain-containing protein n=1 Tax=Trematosphaeria pertusa TaxID=390896 RepID=A0A6A6HU88_9PLEO|nr:uncharacterized protein BU26DRAFT_524829 [Trematosphaeria pertusa]KAF2241666.1 hypothetical protein BU26DRAFT_524829 [Trematosphaeria pertusa]